MSKNNKFFLVALIVSIFLAGVVSNFASSSPDGLEKVAEDIGFIDSATDSAVSGGPLADYSVSGIENAALSGGLAGVVGIIATAVVGYFAFRLLSARRPK